MGKIIERQIHSLPIFSSVHYDDAPVFTVNDYQQRIQSLLNLASSHGLTHVVIYGDREHFSNLYFLTGFDPRFEEALLILSQDNPPSLVVGNEGISYASIVPFNIKKELFQSFSLVGQPRGNSKSLRDIFRSTGIQKSSKVGVIGWKYFTPIESENPDQVFEIPYYIIRDLSNMVKWDNIRNASPLMLHPDYGLRISLDVKELVLHEIAGTKTSQRVLQTIQSLNPGESEIEASQYLGIDGDPLSVHPNVNFGSENVLLGLGSPTYQKRLVLGEVITIGLGYRRALTARTGLFVRKKEEIPDVMEGIVERFYIPYFQALCTWYETIHIGATGHEVFQSICDSLGDFQKFGIGLNPGHFIHTEEWTNSIFYEGSSHKINSGMAIQCDIIAFPGEPYIGVHAEDGILIANENIRKIIQSQYPESWGRMIQRKQYLKDIIGIQLAEEVLPTSAIQASLFPYLGNTGIILARE